jgi:hypothetical protein
MRQSSLDAGHLARTDALYQNFSDSVKGHKKQIQEAQSQASDVERRYQDAIRWVAVTCCVRQLTLA